MTIKLPSGRLLRYPDARLDYTPRTIRFSNDAGDEVELTPRGPSIVYGDGGGDGEPLYGGKLCENVVEGTARDLLGEAVLQLEREGHPALFHVHDEVVVEAPSDRAEGASAAVKRVLFASPAWARDLPVGCEVRIAERYGT